MPRKKTATAPAPPVASTGCSSLRSWSCLPRRAPPQPTNNAVAPAAEQCLKRVHFLEEEIRRLRLSKSLRHEEERPAPPAEPAVKSREAGAGGAGVRMAHAHAHAELPVTNSDKAKEEGRTSTGTDTASSTCTERSAAGVPSVMAKLEDGSYLRQVISRVGRRWDRLAVQVSRPVITENAATASQALDRMAAMRAADLCKLLTQIMPLKDIAGRETPAGEPVRRAARLSTGDDLLEALVYKATDRMEGLVMEGLKIQTATTDFTFTAAADDDDRRRAEPVGSSKNCLVHVVLMQVRDPKQRYGAIGDPMIGIIEASLETKDGKAELEMQGMHVAGISFVNRKASDDSRCMMWSASLRQCRGLHQDGADGCRCNCVRNPNRVFRQ